MNVLPVDVLEPDMELLDPPLKVSCRSCGAQLAYSATDQALRCEYCASVTDIPRDGRAPSPAAHEAIVPLGVSEKALLDAVYEHLAGGTFTPDDLLSGAAIVSKDRFYAPTYEFSGSYEARWTASFGYDRTEHYTAYESRTENGRTRQVPVTRTRIVTDWRPASGHDEGRFQVRAYAGDRLSATEPALMALVEEAHGAQPVAFDASYTAGIPLEGFALAPDAAYQRRGQPQVNAHIDAGVERHGQGDRQRDWHWTATVRKQHRTVMVPVCQVIYDYQGQRYNVWTSGVDTARLVADPLPVDRSRVRALAWGLAPLALALLSSSMAMPTLRQTGEEPVWPVMTVLAAAAFAVWRYMTIVGRSVQRRQALLAARRAEGPGAPHARAPSATASRWMGGAAHRTGLIGACVLAALLPALSVLDMASWRSEPVAPVAVEAPPARVVQPRAVARPPVAPQSSERLTPAQAIAGVLAAARSKDWETVDARLARMKAVAPPRTPGDIEALNDKARRWLRQDVNFRAAEALSQVVVIAPESPSAWATLTEALPDADAGLNALRVAVHLSADRPKTLVYLREAQQNSSSENFARLARAVLKEIDQIPRHPKDSGAPQR